WKDYEVYLDEDTAPVAKGTFEMAHGPQRIPLPKRSVRKIRLKFLNSHGLHNPGASEIAVYSATPSDEQLELFPDMPAPAGPPWVEPAALASFSENPFQRQVEEQVAMLASAKAATRCVALRNLSQMRAYEAADRVADLLSDPQAADPRAEVRCEAAMNLGRTGDRNHLAALLVGQRGAGRHGAGLDGGGPWREGLGALGRPLRRGHLGGCGAVHRQYAGDHPGGASPDGRDFSTTFVRRELMAWCGGARHPFDLDGGPSGSVC
ncbi:hypothetical protein LCGC14_2984700, partial [marine sediment metagenome]